MGWLQRHAWWGLLFMTITIGMFGVTDVIVGLPADPGIPLGLTGLTPAELERDSAPAYRLLDFFTRTQGSALVHMGVIETAVLLFAFRRDLRWAWWTMWLLPAWAAGIFVFCLVAGVVPGQTPPPPMLSGPVFAVLAAAVLVVSAPRFFRRDASRLS
jgi:hypothetical protein